MKIIKHTLAAVCPTHMRSEEIQLYSFIASYTLEYFSSCQFNVVLLDIQSLFDVPDQLRLLIHVS